MIAAHAIFESLESRQLASVSLNTNLIVNGDAEAGPGTADAAYTPNIPGWTTKGLFSVVKYGSAGFQSASDRGVPADHGSNFFSGGKIGLPGPVVLLPSASQSIDVSSLATDIDAGHIKYVFTEFVGGFGKEGDTMNTQIEFVDAKGKTLGATPVAGPTPSERDEKTGMNQNTLTNSVPPGTRSIVVTLTATRSVGYVADGYADDLTLRLYSNMDKPSVAGTVFNDTNGDGKRVKAETGLAGVLVFADTNGNGFYDGLSEPNTTTDAKGHYTLNDVPVGKVTVRAFQPDGFRKTRATSQEVTAVAFLTTNAASDFAFTQRALISGSVIYDPKSGPMFGDTGSNGVAGITLWLDTNGNGKLDSGEKSTVTDEDGNFKLIAPRGRYDLRVKGTSLLRQSTPAKSKAIRMTVGKGGVSVGNVFSMVPIPQ